jgi:hypothetical protein
MSEHVQEPQHNPTFMQSATPVPALTVVERQKIRAASAGDLFVIMFDLICWSRHLVIYRRLLGNRMYWSCQRFADKVLVVVREGISTSNAPYLR